MKTSVSLSRMESMIITMNSLQQKYGFSKLETLVDLMQSTVSSISLALYELRKRNLVIKEGRGKDSHYKLTKSAITLVKADKVMSFLKSNKIAPNDIEQTYKEKYSKITQEYQSLKKELSEERKPKSLFKRIKKFLGIV